MAPTSRLAEAREAGRPPDTCDGSRRCAADRRGCLLDLADAFLELGEIDQLRSVLWIGFLFQFFLDLPQPLLQRFTLRGRRPRRHSRQ